MQLFSWPIAFLPQLRLAGRFALAERDFATCYCSRLHALHLHNYSGRMRLAGKEIRLEPGDLTISPAGLPSFYDLNMPGRHWCIHFEPVDRRDDCMTLPLLTRLAGQGSAAEERFSHIARALSTQHPQGQARARLGLQDMLLWLRERMIPVAAESDAADRAAILIDEHFAEPLTVPLIAGRIGRSQPYLARCFRARFGVTIPHRLLQRRMEHARYLLEATDLPLWRVAERVGMPNAQHFNKTVRRLLGDSPSALRQRAGGLALIDPDR